MFSVELTRFPINEMVSESSPGGIYIPPPGFTFTCGIEVDPPSQGWSHKCLHSCVNYTLALAVGTWHPPLEGLHHEPLQLLTFNTL